MRWVAVAVCTLGIAAATLVSAQGRVAMYRGDASGSGQLGEESADRIGDVRFSLELDGPIRSTPAVAQGRLFVGTARGTFHAVDARSGRVLWEVRTGGAITSSPATDGKIVYFASRDDRLRAVRAADGKPVWTLRFGAPIGVDNYWDYYLSSPVLVGAVLYAGAGDGRLYAVDAASGRVRWTFDSGSRIRATPAVRDGRVVFATTSGHVVALRAGDGALLWRFATQGSTHRFEDQNNDTTSVMASITFAGDIVSIGGRDGFLYGIDAASGREIWRITHDGSSWMLGTAYDGRWLYVGSGSAQIVQAVDPRTGHERWRFATRGAVFAAPALAGRTLLFADFSGTVHAVDKDTGAPQWQFPLRGRALSTPIVANGLVYFASDAGTIIAAALRRAGDPGARMPPPGRRIAFWQGPTRPGAFSWFQNGVDAAFLAYLEAAGYERLDRAALVAWMHDANADHANSVVVFVDNRIPDEIAAATGDTSAIRSYLDAGGKAVLVGPNPLAYRLDDAGQVTDVDFDVPARVFDVRYAKPQRVNGYYASFPTPAGRAIGLRSPFVASGAVDPDQAITVLATDEFGMASAWSKSFGGRPGMGLWQLALPRQDVADYSEVRAAIEAGVVR
jgi:outer membrane protein assembly factor BamB